MRPTAICSTAGCPGLYILCEFPGGRVALGFHHPSSPTAANSQPATLRLRSLLKGDAVFLAMRREGRSDWRMLQREKCRLS